MLPAGLYYFDQGPNGRIALKDTTEGCAAKAVHTNTSAFGIQIEFPQAKGYFTGRFDWGGTGYPVFVSFDGQRGSTVQRTT